MIEPDDKIVEWLQRLEKRAYHEQPDMTAVVTSLICFLMQVFCEHKWIAKRAGGAPDDTGSNEVIEECEKCGANR